MKVYLSTGLRQTVTVSTGFGERELSVKDLADGRVGISLWFDSEKHAKEYADKEVMVGEVEL